MLIYIYGEAACTNPGFPKRHQYYFVMIDAEGRKAGKREDKMSKDGGCHHLCHHLLYQNQVVIWLILLVVAADLSLVLYRSAFSNNPSSQHFTFGQENDSSSSSQDGDSKVGGDLSFQKSTSPGNHLFCKSRFRFFRIKFFPLQLMISQLQKVIHLLHL